MGKKDAKKGGKKGRKYGRSKRPVRWPLMPDGLTVAQAWYWYNNRYEDTSKRHS